MGKVSCGRLLSYPEEMTAKEKESMQECVLQALEEQREEKDIGNSEEKDSKSGRPIIAKFTKIEEDPSSSWD